MIHNHSEVAILNVDNDRGFSPVSFAPLVSNAQICVETWGRKDPEDTAVLLFFFCQEKDR